MRHPTPGSSRAKGRLASPDMGLPQPACFPHEGCGLTPRDPTLITQEAILRLHFHLWVQTHGFHDRWGFWLPPAPENPQP